MSRSRIRVSLVLVIFVVLGHTWCRASAWGNVPLGTKIPSLRLPSTEGKQVTISARGSKALLLLYIRPKHERSARALSDLVKLYRKYSKRGVKAVAISTVRTDAGAVRQLARKLKVPFPVLVDAKEHFYGTYGVFVHPSTGVVDPKGVLRYEYSSHRPGYLITVERQLKAVLGLGPPPSQIKDIDRNATSSAQRKAQRTSRLERMKQRMELKRAQRRLRAAQGILSPESLGRVLELYRAWATHLPPPNDPKLSALAARVRQGKELVGVVKALGALRGQAGLRALWLGRALAALKQRQQALKAFEGCARAGDPLGQCSFELAEMVSAKDPARAVTLCKKGFAGAFGSE